MFSIKGNADTAGPALDAIGKSLAVIEFDPDGTILTANGNFLRVMGYSLGEIKGQHHRMFVEPGYRDSAEYRAFWDKLRAGTYQAAQFKRIGKGGREVWIEASYNPVLDRRGRPVKIIKVATDVSAQKAEYADLRGQVEAIRTSLAVIEFNLDGTVQWANAAFLDVMGYSLTEIKGQHHRMFVEPGYRDSREYGDFWAALRAGEYRRAQFKRVGKGGRNVWIEASYNPILDLSGRPFKVVKYATDVTAQIALLAELKKLIDTNFGEIDRAVVTSNHQSESASCAVQETSENVQAMATSAEELAVSVREIASTMVQSRAATDMAYEQAGAATYATQKLSASSEAMGGVVDLIRSIAGQINLLALNATIESARAGEAGKGFAVVASEVKNLALQARTATDQITQEIERLQEVSAEVVGALGQISGAIDRVREFVLGTANAVEEQSAVTQGMSASMQSAAVKVSGINDNMTAIAAAVHQVEHAVSDTKRAAQVLAR